MTNQMKFLLAGLLLLILVAALALMMTGKKDSVPSAPSVTEEKVADKPKQDPVTKSAGAVDKESGESEVETKVPQAQIDLVTKREEARKRRDEMMKMRSETIKKLGPGNTGEPQQ